MDFQATTFGRPCMGEQAGERVRSGGREQLDLPCDSRAITTNESAASHLAVQCFSPGAENSGIQQESKKEIVTLLVMLYTAKVQRLIRRAIMRVSLVPFVPLPVIPASVFCVKGAK
jgi:hypothetical protein